MPWQGASHRARISIFLGGSACRAATSPSAWSGRNGPPRLRGRSRFGAAKARTAVAPLPPARRAKAPLRRGGGYAALLVAARRVPPHRDAAPCDKNGGMDL